MDLKADRACARSPERHSRVGGVRARLQGCRAEVKSLQEFFCLGWQEDIQCSDTVHFYGHAEVSRFPPSRRSVLKGFHKEGWLKAKTAGCPFTGVFLCSCHFRHKPLASLSPVTVALLFHSGWLVAVEQDFPSLVQYDTMVQLLEY